MAKPVRKLVADRLTVLLTAELKALEAQNEEIDPNSVEAVSSARIKTRVEAVSQITRTLEKLLELRRLETLTLEEASAEDEAETRRLREELMRRLRAVDERRGGGAGLVAAIDAEDA